MRTATRASALLWLAALLFLLAGLAGCATTSSPAPAPVPEVANLSGRLAVRVAASGEAPARSVTALFDLRSQDGQAGELDLSTPMGTIMGRAKWDAQQVTLVTPQGERRYPSLSALSQDVLGESIPVQALFDWLQGRPWPGAPSEPLPAASGGVGFTQLGWALQLGQLPDGVIVAERAEPPQVRVQARLLR
ncbi:MAG: outer membrane lipoprotein LolB [Pseudomonadota bacterium]